MIKRIWIALLISVCLFCATRSAGGTLRKKEWVIDGVSREALIWMPQTKTAAPVVFTFHGHGGSMEKAAANFTFHTIWPEAVIVYMQGLPTSIPPRDPEGRRSGWQIDFGDQKSRDLKFFDAVYASLTGQIDPDRVYCAGHSNGGRFTYLLWAARGELFAALAAASCPNEISLERFCPKPLLHVAGEKDRLAVYALQKKTMRQVRRINRCSSTGTPWLSDGDLVGTIYSSDVGAPFVSLISPGRHALPKAAPQLIMRFFKEHTRKQAPK